MNSTLDDVSDAASNRTRLVLRVIALSGLVAFLVAALFGAFDESAQSATPDGAVTVEYQRSIRPGNGLDIMVSLENASCEDLTLTLDREYAELIDNLALQPEPESETTLADGRIVWQFEGDNPAWVRASGHAADGWSPPVTGTLGVDCGESYEVELTTRRVP